MNLDNLRKERQKWMTWKNILPLRRALEELEDESKVFHDIFQKESDKPLIS